MAGDTVKLYCESSELNRKLENEKFSHGKTEVGWACDVVAVTRSHSRGNGPAPRSPKPKAVSQANGALGILSAKSC